ncbi:MAG: SDR family NAD(P)-dependent oxidoreductase [Sphingomonas sp.]
MGQALLILGGCGGIGHALAALAQERGFAVDVIDLPQSIAERCPAGVRRHSTGDARDEASLSAAFAALAKAGETYAAFVNLCGFAAKQALLAETGSATWDEVIGGNLRAAFLASQCAVPLIAMGGAMVHVGSGLGTAPRAGYGPYGVAKAGLVMLCRQLALELAPGLRVNCVAPGAIDTDFLRGGLGREQQEDRFDRDGYAAKVPLGRMATPQDVARAILFLAGEDSGFITGQVLHVNGGLIMA